MITSVPTFARSSGAANPSSRMNFRISSSFSAALCPRSCRQAFPHRARSLQRYCIQPRPVPRVTTVRRSFSRVSPEVAVKGFRLQRRHLLFLAAPFIEAPNFRRPCPAPVWLLHPAIATETRIISTILFIISREHHALPPTSRPPARKSSIRALVQDAMDLVQRDFGHSRAWLEPYLSPSTTMDLGFRAQGGQCKSTRWHAAPARQSGSPPHCLRASRHSNRLSDIR
jgi:hypothetical protein